MNTTTDTTETPQPPRPFGYWLKAVDRLMAAEFAAAFDDEGITRRDWRLLNVVDGSVERERPLRAHKLRRLIDRGWVVTDGEGWSLTDDGRAAKERLGALVDDIRAKVVDAVPTDDLATTLASLEAIARAFGWEEGTPLPRTHRGPRGHRHGHGFRAPFGHHGFGRHGFGPRGFGPRGFEGGNGFGERERHAFDDRHEADGRHGFHSRGHGHGHDGHAMPEGPCGHGHPGERRARHAFERGYDAGFRRGRAA
ncbi:hypothetical protein [Microbacterium sp. K35]|uniref:hypothetical protein n=1 Tax=Microbacterium sp. K35 TaxID=2305440 RepID=UPI00109BF46E|nr:hypothetical protein [Microbacterium sp. K35]